MKSHTIGVVVGGSRILKMVIFQIRKMSEPDLGGYLVPRHVLLFPRSTIMNSRCE